MDLSATPIYPPPPMTTLFYLTPLLRTVQFIHAGALFHLFDGATQVALAMRLAALLRREKGATIFGSQYGEYVEGNTIEKSSGSGLTVYAHCPESRKILWEKTFGETKIEVKAQLASLMGGTSMATPTAQPGQTGRMIPAWSVTIL